MKKVRLTQRITSRDSQSIKKYLEEIRDISIMTVDEEYEVALRAHDPNLTDKERTQARERLIKANLRFVISVAKQYVSEENPLPDLINEGNEGLIYAALRYDITKGFKFITYAVWWIRRNILAYISSHARLIRLPNNKLALLKKLKEEVIALEQHLERTPTFNEIVDFTSEYSEDDIRFFLQSENENSYSFDKPVQDDDSQTLMSDLYEDTTFGPTDRLLTEDASDMNVTTLLANLKNDKERQVLTLLYGLDGGESLSLLQVAEELDISRERVRQIREKSLKHLKGLLTQ